MFSEDIEKIKLFLFDLDGTLYLGDEVFPFTKELLATIRNAKKDYMFITNNSSKSVEDYIIKLKKMGIKSDREDFMTAAQTTVHFLKSNHPNEKIYVCGTTSLKKAFLGEGISITENADEADGVVVGSDLELTFEKVKDVCFLINKKKAFYYGTNPDEFCPSEIGNVPDCGGICKMLECATGKTPEYIGKPSPLMIELSMKIKGVDKRDTVVVGDRIATDIEAGFNADVKTIMVLSGGDNLEDIEKSNIKPDLVLEDAGKIIEALKV